MKKVQVEIGVRGHFCEGCQYLQPDEWYCRLFLAPLTAVEGRHHRCSECSRAEREANKPALRRHIEENLLYEKLGALALFIENVKHSTPDDESAESIASSSIYCAKAFFKMWNEHIDSRVHELAKTEQGPKVDVDG